MMATHVGSLPRPRDLLATLLEKEEGRPVDEQALDARVQEAVTEVVGLQRDRGIDVVNDGEVGKTSFLAYVNDRLGGFEPITGSARNPWGDSREARDFPEFYETAAGSGAAVALHMRAVGPVTYTGQDAIARDIAHLEEATKDAADEEVFMSAISPTNVEGWQENAFYDTDEEFLYDMANDPGEETNAIMRPELRALADELKAKASAGWVTSKRGVREIVGLPGADADAPPPRKGKKKKQ